MTMTAVAKGSLSTACNSCVSNIGRGANKVSLEKFPPTARNRAAQIDLRQNPIIERSDNQQVIDGSKFTRQATDDHTQCLGQPRCSNLVRRRELNSRLKSMTPMRSPKECLVRGDKQVPNPGVGDQNCSLSKLNERASLAWINVVCAFEVHP